MRILIAANGSMAVNDILTFSKQFIHSVSEPPTILKVLDPGKDRPPIRCDALREQASQILGTNYLTVCTRIGQTVDAIIQETQAGSYDMVIVGDSRPGWLARIIKRSAAERIAEQVDCSVMIAQGKIGPIRRILLCDSGAEKSRLNKFTSQFVDLLGEEEHVTVLHVMSQVSAGPGVRGEQLRSAADELIKAHTPEGDFLNRDVKTFSRMGIHSTPKVRHGFVVDEILAEAHNGDYDLVIIGAHHKNKQGFLLDDLAHQIISRADQPILVVKDV